MITLEEACKIIQNKYPNFRIISCKDYGDFYGMNMEPRTWDGERLTRIAGGIDTVDKVSRAVSCIGAQELCDHNYNYEEIALSDILPYLSAEDAAFALKVQKKKKSLIEDWKSSISLN